MKYYYGTGLYYGELVSAFTPETSISPVFLMEYEVGSGSWGEGSFGDYSPGLGVTYTSESAPPPTIYTQE